MSDHARPRDDNGCCPILREAAMVERLARWGVRLRDGERHQTVNALTIALLREEYGCPGIGYTGRCPLEVFRIGAALEPDENVPLVGKPREAPGEYR